MISQITNLEVLLTVYRQLFNDGLLWDMSIPFNPATTPFNSSAATATIFLTLKQQIFCHYIVEVGMKNFRH